MIIMRALVATVLLITVVLVSIVLINAHTRQVRSSKTTTERTTTTRKVADIIPVFEDFEGVQEDELFDGPPFEQSDSGRTGVNPDAEWDALASEEKVEEDVYTGTGRGPIPSAANSKQETSQQKKKTSEAKKETKPVTTEEFDEVYEEIPYTEDYTMGQGNFEQEEASYSSGPTLSSYEDNVDSSSNPKSGSKSSVKESSGDTYVDSKAVKTSKSRSKESTPSNRKVTQATDRQTPLGYERDDYIVVDEDLSKSKTNEDKDADAGINPVSTRVSRRALGRKQRAVIGSPETYVLNRSPLIPDLEEDEYREPGCPHQFPPLLDSRIARRLERLRPGFTRELKQQQSIYDPLNWDSKTLNMLRFPQCAACQRKSAAVCKSCGRCSDCCGESGCDCGCLNA